MVERSLSMREVPGSMPGFSILLLVLFFSKCLLSSQFELNNHTIYIGIIIDLYYSKQS